MLKNETTFSLCRAMDSLWNRKVVSLLSSVMTVVCLPISCTSSMACWLHDPAVSMTTEKKMCVFSSPWCFVVVLSLNYCHSWLVCWWHSCCLARWLNWPGYWCQCSPIKKISDTPLLNSKTVFVQYAVNKIALVNTTVFGRWVSEWVVFGR